MSTEIVHKTEGHVSTVDTGDIVLEQAAIVRLQVGPELVDASNGSATTSSSY